MFKRPFYLISTPSLGLKVPTRKKLHLVQYTFLPCCFHMTNPHWLTIARDTDSSTSVEKKNTHRPHRYASASIRFTAVSNGPVKHQQQSDYLWEGFLSYVPLFLIESRNTTRSSPPWAWNNQEITAHARPIQWGSTDLFSQRSRECASSSSQPIGLRVMAVLLSDGAQWLPFFHTRAQAGIKRGFLW